MKINLATKNKVKIDALKELISDYPLLKNSEIVIIGGIPSGISEQPLSMEETTRGAVNRAKGAFKDCDYSFGVESGLMKVPNSKSGYMNVTACAIFDGDKVALGLSSGFEFPKEVIKRVLSEGVNVSTAFHRAGFTENDNLRFEDGVIGALTKGRLPRKDYAKESMRNALIHIENSDWF